MSRVSRVMIFSLASSFLLQGCAYFEPTGRYRGLSSEKATTAAPGVSFFVAPAEAPPPPKLRTVADLPEKGLTAAIEALTADGKAASPQQIAGLLDTKLGAKPADAVTDYSKLSRRVVVTVDTLPISDGGKRPADRLDALRVSFKLDTANCPKAQYTDWKQLKNQRRAVNVSVIETETGGKASFSAELSTLSPDLTSLGPSAEVTRRLKETMAVKQDQLSLYGGISPDNLYYVEIGAPLTDLGGTTFIDFDLEVPGTGPYYASSKVTTDGPALSLAGNLITLANTPACAGLTMTGSWEGRVRSVLKGANTFIEADDEIAMVPFNSTSGDQVSREVVFANPPLWKLGTMDQGCHVAFKSSVSTDTTRPLLFRSVSDARTALRWLKADHGDQAKSGVWSINSGEDQLVRQCFGADSGQPLTEQVFSLQKAS